MVHGGWAGAWQWERLTPFLHELNHNVYTPSLTGLGEKHRDATPDVNVSTHIHDIVDFFERKAIHDCIIVGFSYGGMVVTGAVEHIEKRIRSIIYLDAFFPLPGQALFDVFGEKITKSLQAMADAFGHGWLLPYFNKYDDRLTDQPIMTGKEQIYYRTELLASFDPVYIECTEKPRSWAFTPVLEEIARQRREAGWKIQTFPSDHFPMNSKPERLALLFDRLASCPLVV